MGSPARNPTTKVFGRLEEMIYRRMTWWMKTNCWKPSIKRSFRFFPIMMTVRQVLVARVHARIALVAVLKWTIKSWQKPSLRAVIAIWEMRSAAPRAHILVNQHSNQENG